MKSLLIASTVLAGLALGTSAQAVVVNTNGTFSNLTGCTAPATCTLTSNQVRWGGIFPYSSTLSVFDGAFAADLDGIDVSLGTLTWFNATTSAATTDDSFNLSWALADTFTSPTGTGSSSMALNIQNTPNPNGDLIVGFNPGAFTAAIPGYTLTNLEIVVSGGTYNSANGRWTNAENNTSVLTLRGDIIANTPEPMTLSILGMGLIGLSAVRLRRRTGG